MNFTQQDVFNVTFILWILLLTIRQSVQGWRIRKMRKQPTATTIEVMKKLAREAHISTGSGVAKPASPVQRQYAEGR